MTSPETRRGEVEQREEDLALLNRISGATRSAFRSSSRERETRLQELRNDFREQSPEEQRVLETLLAVPGVIGRERRFAQGRLGGAELLEQVQWQHAVRDILDAKRRNPDFLLGYLRLYYESGGRYGDPHTVRRVMSGVLGERAAADLIRSLGFEPRYTSPEEDIHKGVDLECMTPERGMWMPVQVKSTLLRQDLANAPPAPRDVISVFEDLTTRREDAEEEKFRHNVVLWKEQRTDIDPLRTRVKPAFLRIPRFLNGTGKSVHMIDEGTGLVRREPLGVLSQEFEHQLNEAA